MARRRRNPDGDNLSIIVGGVLVSGIVVAALLWWGSSRAAAAGGGALPDPNRPTPIAFFPDLKVGDQVQIDAVAAHVPGASAGSSFATLVCVVDAVLSDLTVISVRDLSGNGSFFKGTIPRSSILRVLSPDPSLRT